MQRASFIQISDLGNFFLLATEVEVYNQDNRDNENNTDHRERDVYRGEIIDRFRLITAFNIRCPDVKLARIFFSVISRSNFIENKVLSVCVGVWG